MSESSSPGMNAGHCATLPERGVETRWSGSEQVRQPLLKRYVAESPLESDDIQAECGSCLHRLLGIREGDGVEPARTPDDRDLLGVGLQASAMSSDGGEGILRRHPSGDVALR